MRVRIGSFLAVLAMIACAVHTSPSSITEGMSSEWAIAQAKLEREYGITEKVWPTALALLRTWVLDARGEET